MLLYNLKDDAMPLTNFTKEVNTSLAKPQSKPNGDLAKLVLTSEHLSERMLEYW